MAAVGLVAPATLAEMFAWFVLPPLHARFLGSIYLFGVVFMAGCLFARWRSEVTWALPLIGVFTGMLFLVSVLNLAAFDLSALPALVWFASYVVYPLLAAVLFLRVRRERFRDDDRRGRPPGWISASLLVQGIVVTLLAVALFLVPQQVAPNWPWRVTPFLAQAYSGPLLAYGLGSLLASRSRSWSEIRTVVPAMLAFVAVALVVSIVHLEVFGPPDLIDVLWFGAFATGTALLAVTTIQVLRGPRRAR